MTRTFNLCIYIFCSSVFPMYLTISSSLYSTTGSWCPYQVEKVVPCRVRNGSEPYYGTNICWRNENGSYACSKKLMYRPRYTTTYKKIRETRHRCCPGRDGPNCQNECFNCTDFRQLEDRLLVQERRLGRIEKSLFLQKSSAAGGGGVSDRFNRDFSSENTIYSAATLPAAAAPGENERSTESPALSLAYATLNLRVQNVLDEFREMQNQIRFLENEVSRLNAQVDDLSLNNAYDYTSAAGGGAGAIGSLHGGSKDDKSNAVLTSSSSIDKDSPTSTRSQMANDERNRENRNQAADDKIGGVSTRHEHETRHHRHSHHHHHHHKQQERNTDLTIAPHSQENVNHRDSFSKSEDVNPFRVLEENLERGDIASTLNDDYGDELYNDNSTEQYMDQLQAKRDQHSP